MAGDTSQYVELSFLRSVPRTLYRPGEKRKEQDWSLATTRRRVTSPSIGIVSLTYENTLSDIAAAAAAAGYTSTRIVPGGEIY